MSTLPKKSRVSRRRRHQTTIDKRPPPGVLADIESAEGYCWAIELAVQSAPRNASEKDAAKLQIIAGRARNSLEDLRKGVHA